MNIISNYSKDTKTEKVQPGSYEWWYFDAVSVDGYKIVIIFYDGNPFSRRYIKALEKNTENRADYFPAISISVYDNGTPIFYSFREVEPEGAEFSKDTPFGSIENCYFKGKNHQARLQYSVKLDQKLASGDSIQSNLLFSNDIQSMPNFSASDSDGEAHVWNLILPSCHVKGDITIDGYENQSIKFIGLGYHDHNTGFEPLKNSFKEWYWGRYHMDDTTFVYYLMNRGDYWENKAWLVDKNGTVEECNEIEMSNFGMSIFGLSTARVIECKANGMKLHLQLDQVLDNGPFYQRFAGRLICKDEFGVSEAIGISEYIKPDRIYKKLFRPLVNMRITYPGKIHWVQRSPHLYRWTW